jgi:hypothetical protein
MGYYLTDDEIHSLIHEPKPYPGTRAAMMHLKTSDGHKRGSFDIQRADGSQFIVKLRQNMNNVNDFSAIIGFQEKGNSVTFILKRYNGKSHEHSNKIEKTKIYNFHIHTATQRYQDENRKEESYAEETNRCSNLVTALDCLIEDCQITLQPDPQRNLFG